MEKHRNQTRVQIGQTLLEDRRISEQFATFQVSSGFYEFQNCMNRLYELMVNRLLFSSDESVKMAKSTKESWIHENVYNRDVDRLRKKFASMQLKWEKMRITY